MTNPPHSRSNFITENGLIIIGAKPESFTINDIINVKNLSLIVNLVEEEKVSYLSYLPNSIELIFCPIKSGKAPTKKSANEIFLKIKKAYENGNAVYIHCNGGHGRAGTLGAYVIGKLKNYDAFEAISEIEKWRLTRPDQSRNFIPTPETDTQVAFLVRELGLKKGNTAPDRSDRSWLAAVRKARK
jgi:protein tyrosine phosphatase